MDLNCPERSRQNNQTLPQAVRPAAADIEGYSAAAKLSQPGRLSASVNVSASE
jgi:hypothetical protein